MKILITGASGFVGSQIVTDLIKEGHEVYCCVRDVNYTKRLFPQAIVLDCDFIKDTKISSWMSRLKGIDCVINTVGIFFHPQKKIIWRIHFDTPKALFDACVASNIKKVIHISALGADRFDNDYAKSKKAADDYLAKLPLNSVILRPSLIYGRGSHGGTSLFRGLAGIPFITPIPGQGEQQFQPIFLQDLSKAVIKLIEVECQNFFILSAVSNPKINLKQILINLREWLGFSKTFLIYIPFIMIRLASFFGNIIPNSVLNGSSYKMLKQNNVATDQDTAKFQELIGFKPFDFPQGLFSQPSYVQDRWHARLYFIKPLLQFSLAFVWIFSGLTSLFFFPRDASYHLLEQVGISANLHSITLIGASLLDILIGGLLLINFQVRKLCVLQIIVLLSYTTIITFKLPGLWLEPFGPITKNLPFLVSIFILYILEGDR